MYFAAILMSILIGQTIHVSFYAEQDGFTNIEDCSFELGRMRNFIASAGLAGVIVKEACWTKGEWIDYLGRNPWSNSNPGKRA